MANPTLNLISFSGIFVLCAIAWLGSEDRRIIPWKTLLVGIGGQLLIGALFFLSGASIVEGSHLWGEGFVNASETGARFLFGNGLNSEPEPAMATGAAVDWILRALGSPDATMPEAPTPWNASTGFALSRFPAIVVWSALVGLLYGLNWIQPVVQALAWVFSRAMNLSGAESLAGGLNLLVGIEAAIAIKPFLWGLTRSELCAVLSSGLGSLASAVLGLSVGLLRPAFLEGIGPLIIASLLTIPACFVVSKLLVPETEIPETMGDVPEDLVVETQSIGAFDGFIDGAIDGVKIVLKIIAIVIAILGLVKLLELFLLALGSWLIAVLGTEAQSESLFVQFLTNPLQNFLGMLFLPFTFFAGISLEWEELWNASLLIGRRLIETSLSPYQSLALMKSAGEISDRAFLIVGCILCGFAHFAGYGVFVGGVSALIPERRGEVAVLGFKALWAATLATLMAGCVVGVFSG